MALAILLIIVGVGLPAMITAVRKGPMRQAISDLEEGFLKARMLAILTGQPAEFVIQAANGTLAVRAVTDRAPDAAGGEATDRTYDEELWLSVLSALPGGPEASDVVRRMVDRPDPSIAAAVDSLLRIGAWPAR